MRILKIHFLDLRFLIGLGIRLSIIFLLKYFGNFFPEYSYLINSIKSPYNSVTNGALQIYDIKSPYHLDNFHENLFNSSFYLLNFFHKDLSKYFLCFIDVLCAFAIELLLLLQKNNKKPKENKKNICSLFNKFLTNEFSLCGCFYLYNPIIIYLCGCGITDSFTLIYFIITLILIELDLYYIAAFFFAFMIHLTIFTFTFTPLIYFYIMLIYHRDKKVDIRNNLKQITLPQIFTFLFSYQANIFLIISIGIYIFLVFISFCLFGNRYIINYFFYHLFYYSYYIHNNLCLSIFTYPLSIIRFTLLYNMIHFLIAFQEILITIFCLIPTCFMSRNSSFILFVLLHLIFNKQASVFQIYWLFGLIPLLKNNYSFKYLILGFISIIFFFKKISLNYDSDYIGKNVLIGNWLLNIGYLFLHCVYGYFIIIDNISLC